MDINKFKSGTQKKQYGYKSFTPEPVNHDWLLADGRLSGLLSSADRKLGELNALSMMIPDVNFFIKMHITKEATQSSRIEGTQTSIDEALQSEAYISPDKKDDWQEVHNYIEAMNYAIKQMDRLPLSNRLLKLTQKKLLQGVRGKHKLPGEFRSSQNWIGGSSIKDATFIPPHHTDLPDLMADLELLLNNEDLHVPHLIRIAIAHYQFETIHPFLDGNGRLGRLLITLYLVSNNILAKPTLYLSDFFERNRIHYYDNLTQVRTNNNLKQWLLFFLVGINETAESGIATFYAIMKLRQKIEEKQIIQLGKKVPMAKKLISYLYSKPIVDIPEIAGVLEINISTAHRLVQDFEKLKILKEQTGFKRNKVFVFEQYLSLFR
ncbi:MAG: Fic/DOC family N-terminal domain-containing protein [Bacteroidota bacterium]|nr:Fic/DOC family N-terminal domain-containing protein [Bacteroidota bacterium]